MCNPRESVLFGFAAWLTEESRAWVSGVKPRPPPPPPRHWPCAVSLTLQGLVTRTTGENLVHTAVEGFRV